ncbi:ABC transporter substrate-binding protein [Actinopolymorpha pittospori]|uniref:Multiple sugar transport system substrate-binding protein n=1 Tax=Actinopolymorpha pittospori TaxID=648752 RepID=A0A927MYF8_9ACTN|nr:extracellular solute-binding protein [Actinopolymorpha pittospori]MBE1608874.1 multiple sugar transport system substrate-binding protein [Actinopolymorpha pittospori]
MPHLRGMTWSHPRGSASVHAATAAFTAVHPEVTVEWAARSLQEFEDVPVVELARRFDLIAIDHPFVGQAAATGALLPLDEVLPAETLAEQERNSVGPSYRSYAMAGHQWALPMDAAAQVSAYRPDLLQAPLPRTWDEAHALLASLPAGVVAESPANPTHLWSTFISLCHHVATEANLTADGVGGRPRWWPRTGIDPSIAVAALERVYQLLHRVDPVSLTRDPIQTLDAMAAGAPIGYVPLVFGYSNYARDGHGRHLLRFADAPYPGPTPVGTMTGGVGLAVSAQCADPGAAVDVAAWIVSEACQRGTYLHAGGQPGHRRAWTDPSANDLTHGFFADTLATLDASFLRARDAGYPRYQQRAGELLHERVRRQEPPAAIGKELLDLWQRTVTENGDEA